MKIKKKSIKYSYEALFTLTSEYRWLVTFPSFPHLHTDGETLAEARKEAQDALLSEIEISKKLKVEMPLPLKSYLELIEVVVEVEEYYKRKKKTKGERKDDKEKDA